MQTNSRGIKLFLDWRDRCKMEQQKSGVKKQQTSNRLIEHTTDIAFGMHSLNAENKEFARANLLIFFLSVDAKIEQQPSTWSLNNLIFISEMSDLTGTESAHMQMQLLCARHAPFNSPQRRKINNLLRMRIEQFIYTLN